MVQTIFLRNYHVAQQYVVPTLQDRLRIDIALFALKNGKYGNGRIPIRHWDAPPRAQKKPRAVPGDIPDLQIRLKSVSDTNFGKGYLRAS